MKDYFIIKVYKVNILEPRDGGLYDSSEQADKQLDEDKHFLYQIGGESINKAIGKCIMGEW